MKHLKLTIIIFTALAFQGCDDDGDTNCSIATGEVIEEEFFLDPFTKVSLEISADVFVSKGDQQQVIVEAQSSIVDELLKTSVVDGYWDIELENCLNTTEGINIYVTIPNLEEVSISGSGDVVVQDTFSENSVSLRTSGSGSITGNFETTSIECTISGSGETTIIGTAQTSNITISGSGSVEAFEMLTIECDVSISGSGSANVNVSEFLEVSIAGSGNVRYKGNPSINSSISGSGRVIDAN